METIPAPGRLMGPPEIMREYRIPRNTFYRWIREGHFPPPYQRLQSGPVWDRREIEKRFGARPH